jgi:hypothetical protein
MRKGADTQEELISQLVALEPENLSDGYVGTESSAYGDELHRLLAWRNKVISAQSFATAEIGRFEDQIAQIEALKIGVGQGHALTHPAHKKKGKQAKKLLGGMIEHFADGGKSGNSIGLGSAKPFASDQSNTFDAHKKAAYKIPALEEAIANAKTMRDETWAGELEEIQGSFGGHELLASLPSEPTAGAFGGRIFEIQNSIRELGLRVASATDEATSQLRELEAQTGREWHQRYLVSEAQRNTIADFTAVYPPGFAGMFAAGGSIPRGMWGIAGETGRPEVVHGPATVMSPEESAAMFGAGGRGDAIAVVINGTITQESGDTRDPIEVLRNGLKDPGVRAEIQKLAAATRMKRRGSGGAR